MSFKKIARLGTAVGFLLFFFYIFLISFSRKTLALMKNKQEYKINGKTYITIYAEDDRWNSQGKYYEVKYKIEKNPSVARTIKEVYVQELSFYCETTRSDNVCSENGKGKHMKKIKFEGNTATYTIIRYPNNTENCGSFQADLRVVKIILNDGTIYTDTSGITPGKTDINRFVWAGCNVLNSNFNCGLPENWRVSCTQNINLTPTSTPTNTPTPIPTNTPASTPTPTPQNNQSINQNVNVNQNVTIQNSANNVLEETTQKPTSLPKAGSETIILVSSFIMPIIGVLIKKKL